MLVQPPLNPSDPLLDWQPVHSANQHKLTVKEQSNNKERT